MLCVSVHTCTCTCIYIKTKLYPSLFTPLPYPPDSLLPPPLTHLPSPLPTPPPHTHTHPRGHYRNLQTLILQDTRAVGIKSNEIRQREKLTTTNVVVPTIGINLEMVDVSRSAEVGDGIVPGLCLALSHQVHALLPVHLLQTTARSLSADAAMEPPSRERRHWR